MNSFSTLSTLEVEGKSFSIHNITELEKQFGVSRLPFSLKILLENLLRHEDGRDITQEHIKALATWQPGSATAEQISFSPARVILQDFTGVPAIVDLAAMRDAMAELGSDPALINPQIPVDLVIDHSVMVDRFASMDALDLNRKLEFQRNKERYQFLRWGQEAFDNFRVVPPGTGIVHQVNLEYLADVVTERREGDKLMAFPDTLVGTDSHTTMINGLGVLGWGVGGIEAEAAMLGQAITLLIPEVVGFEITGKMPAGTTATDLVLMVTEKLRSKGVVGKFVEFHGDGLSSLPLADRATISNMAPEYGATCGIFPIDAETLRYLRLTGRDQSRINLVEAYARAQGLWREDGDKAANYSDSVTLDLSEVRPSIAGPKRPQDRIDLSEASDRFHRYLVDEGRLDEMPLDIKPAKNQQESRFDSEGGHTAIGSDLTPPVKHIDFDLEGAPMRLHDGDVVIAAITSCTNTSNPAVMMAAGLLAKRARERGLTVKPWVKTSLAPGSQVVPQYLESAELMQPLRELGFHVVGFGCTTCIGNSGPLPEEVSQAIRKGKLVAASVLSGNRNFEGRIHQEVQTNYLASPPLVVAYALAGSMRIDLTTEPLGEDADGKPVFLTDIWPSAAEVAEAVETHVSSSLFGKSYADVFEGAEEWKRLDVPGGNTYQWPESTYVKKPPFFEGISANIVDSPIIKDARCLVMLGDSVTTDHISPAGAILPDSPAGEYLLSQGVSLGDFNSLGSRRGNHEVMMRGTFANVRLRNQLAPGSEGSVTRHLPDGESMSIYAAGMQYQREKTPLVVLAGREYGTGSSRDWAAKGTRLLGVSAVIAQSYERIHRSNLIGFGVLPLQYQEGDDAESLGLSGEERFTISSADQHPATLDVRAENDNGKVVEFTVDIRIDTPVEWDYYRHGGILHYVLRSLASDQSEDALSTSA
ncbi:aconitate hydratase AcnA [Granulosicoccus antarcticus]|uniref:Aconitate hydratase n=1 Tax=Granulosicoccus antarcticus IMCC3135 TaxID=1192854 RepID=A0A2Z2NHU0_9GAMM|nr:aconitate hydratase AcnA [Granulosicoccus antarcticus]ASJ70866.1 Aconitate hydratase A [Granulosicoccus antarcticus IMCC3135]